MDGFGATLEQEQEQDDRTIRPIVLISLAIIDSERHWTPLDLRGGQHHLEHPAPSRLPFGIRNSVLFVLRYFDN